MSEARQIEKVLKERVVQAVLTKDNVYSEFVYAAQCNVYMQSVHRNANQRWDCTREQQSLT